MKSTDNSRPGRANWLLWLLGLVVLGGGAAVAVYLVANQPPAPPTDLVALRLAQLHEGTPESRVAAAVALGDSGSDDDRVARALCECLQEGRPVALQDAAAQSLAKLGPKALTAALAECRKPGVNATRREQSLGQM